MPLQDRIAMSVLAAALLAVVLGVPLFIWRRWRLRRLAIRKRPKLEFSLVGIVYCALLLFMGLAAVNSQANLLFGVFGLMIGVLLVSGAISRRGMRGISVRRILPDHCVVGRPFALNYEVTNSKRFSASMSLTLAELDGALGFKQQPAAYLLHAAPRSVTAATTQVTPVRRGLHQFGRFQLSSAFPFGFISRASTHHRAEVLLAYPPLASVDPAVLQRCKALDRTGAAMHPTKGGSDEFYGMKEHRPGNNPRYIHWRRSARTAALGTLAAREMTQAAPPRILILLDTFQPKADVRNTARQDGSAKEAPVGADVEKAIAIAASLAATALDAELAVGLICWFNGWRVLEPGNGKRHRNDLLSVLAQVPANTSGDRGQLLQHARPLLQTGATGVLCAVDPTVPAETVQRNEMLVLSPYTPDTRRWFRFEPYWNL